MTTWITRLDQEAGDGPLLAVKDAIDVEGVPTTVGCAAIADTAAPAAADAPCVAAMRKAGARVAGKANLHELCFGTAGTNPWYGTPVNPIAPDRLPGGSSSGSAVAVATGEVDLALGTDTGGSVRIPSAACGIVGLKTTWRRVSLDGVWPLAPTLDTVGPMARDVAGIVTAMSLLEPGFEPAPAAATVVGRLVLDGDDFDYGAAVDRALAGAGFTVVPVVLPGIAAADAAFVTVIVGEAWRADAAVIERAPDRVGAATAERLRSGAGITDDQLVAARDVLAAWQTQVAAVFQQVEVLALPTLEAEPPRLDGGTGIPNRNVRIWNCAGTPAISLPLSRVPGRDIPPSLQLVGYWNAEPLLCATAAVVEAGVGQG